MDDLHILGEVNLLDALLENQEEYEKLCTEQRKSYLTVRGFFLSVLMCTRSRPVNGGGRREYIFTVLLKRELYQQIFRYTSDVNKVPSSVQPGETTAEWSIEVLGDLFKFKGRYSDLKIEGAMKVQR